MATPDRSGHTSPAALPAVPGYTLLAVIGQGGMGTVYKAEQSSPRRIVALKLLRGAASATNLAAFRQEAKVIAGLEHPHIVPLYGFGEHAGAPFLALRFLPGGSVADQIRKGPIDLKLASRWLLGAADALDFAHQRGIIHRDVKPSNILLDESNNAYLSDFGIAGILVEAQAGAPTGSAAYMSPEQGQGAPVDGRADLYALAVTLFEMLTGQRPYTAETALGVIVRHVSDPIPSAQALNPAVPSAVDELIQWGMAKDPAQRPQSGAEFSGLLRRAIARPNEPLPRQASGSTQTAAGLTPTLVVASKKSNLGLWLAGAIGLAAVCVVGSAVLLGGGALAAGILAPSPVPTGIELPTEIPAPTAAPTPQGQLLADDFSNPRSGFAVKSDQDGGVAYASGAYEIRVLTKGREWSSPSGRVKAADVVIEVDARQVPGRLEGEVAVLCRWQDENNYTALAINGAGTYSIWQKRGGKTARLVDWTPAQDLSTGLGATRRLRVTCSGPQLRLEVDGAVLGETTDPNPVAGDIALMAGLREAGPLLVRFEALRVRQPGQ